MAARRLNLSWLSLHRGEGVPVALCAAAAFMSELSEAFTANCADALYLGRHGAGGLGALLAVSAVVLAMTLATVGAVADRWPRERILAAIGITGAGLLVGMRVALTLWPAGAPAVLVVLSKQISAALDLGIWVLVADRFDARQGRRIVPLIVAAGGVGLVGGSWATQLISSIALVGVEDLLILGAVGSLAAGLAGGMLGWRGFARRAGSGSSSGTASSSGSRPGSHAHPGLTFSRSRASTSRATEPDAARSRGRKARARARLEPATEEQRTGRGPQQVWRPRPIGRRSGQAPVAAGVGGSLARPANAAISHPGGPIRFVRAIPALLARTFRDGVRATRGSELARRLALVVTVAGAFGPIIYTALGAAAGRSFHGEADLAAFYGKFRGLTSLATLAAQALLGGRSRPRPRRRALLPGRADRRRGHRGRPLLRFEPGHRRGRPGQRPPR